MDRAGVMLEKPKGLVRVEGPFCINGNWYTIFKDVDGHWFDFNYGIYRRAGFESGFSREKIVSASVTLLGARVFLWKLRRFR